MVTNTKEKINEEYAFQIVKPPQPETPLLEVRLVKYPIYKGYRTVTERGEKKNTRGLIIGLTLGASDLIFQLKGAAAVGGALFVGAWFTAVKWKPAERTVQHNIEIKDQKDMIPLAHKRIKAYATSISQEWQVSTNINGQVALDLSETAHLVEEGSDLHLTFESLEDPKISNSFTIEADFFSGLNKYYASIHPPDLRTDVKFDESGSFINNQMIDGAEKSFLVVTVENRGEGQALDVKLFIDNSNPDVAISPSVQIGTILPGEKIEKRIPLAAMMDISDGQAVFTVQTKEQRRYDARPMQLQIPVRHLDKPKFELTTLQINDARIGLAAGNGNGIPENGETIELVGFIKNIGVGRAYDAVYALTNLPQELEVIQESEKIGTLLPGQSVKAKTVFKIPSTYTAKTIPLSIKISDALNADVLEKRQTLSMGINLPILAYQFVKPPIIHNGEQVKIQMIPENAGKLAANNIEVQITSPDAVTLTDNYFRFPSLAPGSKATTQVVTVAIPRTYSKPSITLNVKMNQSNFEGLTRTETLPLELRKPELQISERLFDANQNSRIEQGEKIELTVTVTNNGQLSAENVSLNLETTDARFNRQKPLGIIPPLSSQETKFILEIPWGIQPGAFPMTIIASQDDYSSVTRTLNYEIAGGEAIVQTLSGQPSPATLAVPSLAVGAGANNNQAPTIFVQNPAENGLIVELPALLEINFGDDRYLSQARVYLNGELIYDSQNDLDSRAQIEGSGGKLLAIKRSLQYLKTGNNILEITASDNANEVSSQTRHFSYQPGTQISGGIVLNPAIDIEGDIPQTNAKNLDAIAVILGVEQYKDIPKVTYARRDAALFREYAVHVLGVPDDASHIYYKTDADVTGGEFRKLFGRGNWLEKHISPASDIYIYYAGHGAPDIDSKTPYLIPYEGDANYVVSTGFGLDEIYEKLGQLNARSITVFLDACFSGLTRDNEMLLADARPVGISLESPVLRSQKMVTFSAASGSQISNGYPAMQHGLFTYFLLKGLKGEADQNGNKEITVGELEAYLVANVQRISGSFGSNREQRPQVMGMDKGRVVVKY